MQDTMNLKDAARHALACLDLTSLNEGDTPGDIEALCRRAVTPHGTVAAVCVWPRFVAQARAALPPEVAVAAVANFPHGQLDAAATLAEIQAIAAGGAQEIDVVFPYRAYLAGQHSECEEFLAEVRHASRPLTLKLIIESGELVQKEHIAAVTRMALMAGVDFVKTSTGKTATSATPKAAQTILHEIAASGLPAAGFKASGGIRSVADAQIYLYLVAQHLGLAALQPRRFRLGASSLLNDIERVLSDVDSPQGQELAEAAY